MPPQSLKASPDGLPKIKEALSRTKAFMEQEYPERNWKVSGEAWAEEASRTMLKISEYEWVAGSKYPSGISVQTWNSFRKGEPVLPDTFKCYCKILQLDWEKVVDKSSSGLENNRQNSLEFVNNSKFRSLIADKTQDFVGREYIFKAIKNFINDYDKGYLTITGHPGQGKSAILAKYVQDTNCIAHFNISSQGPNRTDQFLESICNQLIRRYQLPYNSLPPNSTRDGEFFQQLLGEATQKSNGQHIIIAVDALDEVDPANYRDSLENILFLPSYLPDNVYFILTIRLGVDIPLMVYTPFNELSLLDYQSDSERDVRTYIQKRINSSEELRFQIAERGETIEDFTNKISDKSENNFIYLRFVLLGIEKGEYKKETLEKFPKGLENYYDFHWRYMSKRMTDIKIKIIYLLAKTYEPVSRGLLAKYASPSSLKKISEVLIQEVLDDWLQFLHRYEIEQEICYRVYHSSFIDFLYRKDIVKAAGIEITEIHCSIADTLWEGLYGEEE
jgi:serine/threonine-protein kinase